MKRIVQGIKKFQEEVFPQKRELFQRLAGGQSPQALVISCADSRVDMDLLTQTEPGELFYFRNAGNIIPPYGAAIGAISATLEFAMVALEIPHIIVCGHSDCGAMKGIQQPEAVREMPTVSQWLQYSEVARQMTLHRPGGLEGPEGLRFLTHMNVVAQLDNLRTHPSVALRFDRGELQLHGWYYDIPNGQVSAYDAAKGKFVPVDGGPPPLGAVSRPALNLTGA